MAGRLTAISKLSKHLGLAPFLAPALQRAPPPVLVRAGRTFASLAEISTGDSVPPEIGPSRPASFADNAPQSTEDGEADVTFGLTDEASAIALPTERPKSAKPTKRHHGLNTSMLFRPNEKVIVPSRPAPDAWLEDLEKLRAIVKDGATPESVNLQIQPRFERMAKELHMWSQQSKVQAIFERMKTNEAAYAWNQLFKAAIVLYPTHALRLVKLTFPAPYVNDYAIKGALELLIMRFAQPGESMNKTTSGVIVTALAQLLKSRAGHAALPNEYLELLTHHIDVNDSAGLYSLLRVRKNVEFSSSYHQRLVQLFASKRQYHRLATVLLDMRKGLQGWVMVTPAFRPKWYALVDSCSSSFELRSLHQALEEADLMTSDLYHAFTAVSYARGDSKVMWRIFKAQTARYFSTDPEQREILQQTLPTNTQISRLFQDAKRLRDPDRLGKVLSLVAKDPGYYNSTYLNAGMMHLISRTHDTGGTSQPRSKRYVQMLKHYMQFFDCSALQRLGLPVPDRGDWNPEATLQPAPHQLRILMIGYILSQNPGPRFGSNIRLIYRNLMAAADNKDPMAMDLVKDTLIFDHVIAHISWDISELPFCTTVMKDVMMRSKQYEENPAENLFVGPPIERTWSALHFAFCSRSQMASAARVRQMMVEQGFPLLPKVWNDVIKGFGRMQNIPGIIMTMREMAERGIDFDDETVRNLQLIDDREELLKQLEAVTGQDFTEYFNNAPIELKTFWSQRSAFIEHDLEIEEEVASSEQEFGSSIEPPALDQPRGRELGGAEHAQTVPPVPVAEVSKQAPKEATLPPKETMDGTDKLSLKPGKQSAKAWNPERDEALEPPEPKELYLSEGQVKVRYENDDIDIVSYESKVDLQEREDIETTLEDLDETVKKPKP